ncbi:MAG: UvrD-helicase domain-containing protein [Paludibacteraceae bacterium]
MNTSANTTSQIDLRYPMNVCRASAGTGKTFTLAACYVGLLLSGESYRNILAVTFTNKATEEMKERILTYLYAIATGNRNEAVFFDKAKTFMIANRRADDAALRKRAAECFGQMLLDYDNVQVSTIDSFLQTLLSGMAKMLGKSAGYTTELNLPQAITTAVDQILTTEMNGDMEQIMADYMNERVEREEKWDIRQSIITLAENLYDESVQMLEDDDKIVFDPKKILAYKKRIDAWRERGEMKELAGLLEQVKGHYGHVGGKSIVNALDSMVLNIEASLDATTKMELKERFRGLTDTKCKEMEEKADAWTEKLGEPLFSNVSRLQALCKVCRKIYLEWHLTTAFLMDMRIMRGLIDQINNNLRESNRTLLAKTASTLRSALKPGDADFVLEKTGIRYKHIMMDEFQDTSKLQWGVFLPLLQDLLASDGHTLFIVGDIKQSIYRWRNGDWHIMDSLGKADGVFEQQNNPAFQPLVRNFRSRRNVVQFNLQTLQRVLGLSDKDKPFESLYDEGYKAENLSDFYNLRNDGGYVRLRVFPKYSRKSDKTLAKQTLLGWRVARDIMRDMFDTIEDLLEKGERPADIMILVRTKGQAQKVIKYIDSMPADTWRKVQAARIVSGDSFQLDRSVSVLLVIKALHYIETGDTVAAKYIELVKGNNDCLVLLKAINRQTPLYEMVQTIIKILTCDETGKFIYDDIAYINCFLDKVRDFVASNSSNSKAFIRYWEDNMHSDAIPAPESDAIRIMTIHSSKGLESKTLFIPFCSWEMENDGKDILWCLAPTIDDSKENQLSYVPVWDSKTMLEVEPTYSAAYQAEHKDQRVDNLNLLYVALTRAADNLYIYVDYMCSDKSLGDETVGVLLVRAYDLKGRLQEALAAYNAQNEPESMCYTDYVLGTEAYIHSPKADNKIEPFSFRQAEDIAASLRSDSGQVRFRQSQESAIYAMHGAEAEHMIDRIAIGNICHDILSRTEVHEDVESVIDDFYDGGIIETEEQRKEIRNLINGAWTNPRMCDWFSGAWQLLREQAILLEGEECRPDRIMIRGTQAIVLDYKFGQRQSKYARQVRRYMEAMRSLGYTEVSGYLWYANEQKLEEVE